MNQEKDRKIYTLDTSALLTYIEDEEGSNEVEELLVRAENGEVDIYIALSVLQRFFILHFKKKMKRKHCEG